MSFIRTRNGWLGASTTLRFNKDFGAILSGGALLPFDEEFTLHVLTGQGAPYDDNYNHDTQWSIIEALGTYNMLGLGEALFGFRWDHFTTRWSEVNDTDPDYYNFKLNYFLPVVGVQSRFGTETNQVVARVLGFPFVPGTVLYDYQFPSGLYSERGEYGFDRGYFLEAGLDYICRPFEGVCAGLFFRYNTIHTSSEALVEETTGAAAPTVLTETHILGLYRTTWTLGGMFSWNFDLGGSL
jgi:hypothetical protein